MIKGVGRRVIVIERTDDPYFERAVLFLKSGVGLPGSKQSLIKRAQAILDGIGDGDVVPGTEERARKKRQSGEGTYIGRLLHRMIFRR